MKWFFVVFLALCPGAVFAADESVPVFNLLIELLGDKGTLIVGVLCTVGYIWALVRQCIPASWLASLPDVLVDCLEWLAANKGHAANKQYNAPKFVKRTNAP
ncbi:hypothetical protein AB4391_24045 [Vibrio lentus]|uniref:Uncharacterized protein n=1 Tax=Vibrio lentus TaxID=136468 RepID=A0A2N7KEY2_9VIBR|nr:hypothetical protein [Vibrio lentus]PMM74292.1 hypothetical protein BCT49_24195 [Vibrio lentus]